MGPVAGMVMPARAHSLPVGAGYRVASMMVTGAMIARAMVGNTAAHVNTRQAVNLETYFIHKLLFKVAAPARLSHMKLRMQRVRCGSTVVPLP